jgi:acylphosphatase
MKRASIIVKGRVQRIGYRGVVEEVARKLNITGFVENLKPYDVRIVAEGEDEDIDKFIERIKIRKFPIDVEDLEVTFEAYKGEFEYFEIKLGDWHEELFERLDTAGTLLYRSVELGERSVELGERSVELGERSVELGEKNVALSEKSVKLGEESVSIGKKMLEKQDNTIKAIDQSKEEIVTEIRSLREDLKTYMENKFAKIEHEIEVIKTKIGMV